ncbi:MAG: hypothetical protein FVQ77_13105 [Cytophagales bacterium]|nr:hypothetical protein [Cytophagales bacterium]
MKFLENRNYDEGANNIKQLASLNLFIHKIYSSNPNNPAGKNMNITDKEVLQFFRALNDHSVKYMLVGGVATAFHGYVRATQDLDLWIQKNDENKEKLINALRAVDVQGAELYRNIPLIPGFSSVKIGDKGFEADLMEYMRSFTANQFDNCYERARKTKFEGVPFTVIHIDDLIKEKKALNRGKDKIDVEELEKIRKKKDRGMSM